MSYLPSNSTEMGLCFLISYSNKTVVRLKSSSWALSSGLCNQASIGRGFVYVKTPVAPLSLLPLPHLVVPALVSFLCPWLGILYLE